MGKDTMSRLRLKTVLAGFSLLTAYSISAFAAADGDPKMAQPAASAASAALEAGSPTTPAASAPKAAAPAASAASAPKAAASAASAPESAEAAAPAPAPVKLAQQLTTEFYGFAYAIGGLPNIIVHSDGQFVPDPKTWPTSATTKSLQTFTSEDEKMHIALGRRKDLGLEVVTANEITNRATMTVFSVDKKPISHTIVGKDGSYTATEKYCGLLKTQTKSKSFSELAEKAKTCSDFYARTDASNEENIQEHLNTHRANIKRMENSAANEIVGAERDRVVAEARSKLKGRLDPFRRMINATYGVPAVTPRPILSKSIAAEDIKDRGALTDLAEACGRLWSGAGSSAAPTAAAPKAKDATVKK